MGHSHLLAPDPAASPAPSWRQRGQHLRRVVLSLWTWGAIGLATVAGCVAQVLLFPVTVPWDRQRRVVGRIFRLGAVTAIKLSPMWRFSVDGPLPAVRPRRTVVVSNHVSHLDAFLIAHLPWEMKWLAKASLFRIPFLGWSMRLAGDILVVRDRGASIAGAMRRCAAYLAAGMPVFIFPEGTRSTEAGLLPFKDGAFRLAIEAGADILPLAVAGTRRALPKNAWTFDDSRGLVRVGAAISTRGMTLVDLAALKARVRGDIDAMLAELRDKVTLGERDLGGPPAAAAGPAGSA